VQILPTEEEVTAEPAATTGASASGDTAETGTAEGSVTPEATATKANPIDLPFLMKIDRVSVVVGKGTLLEGQVAHGTLQQNGDVEILGPQGQVLSTSVLATFVSSVAQDQVTVGDYARILVENVDTNQVKPGLLVSEAGAYTSYEEALAALQ
jgi:translation elongation factor EF-Tu-like GTPase